ncbi:MAG TPA: GNAT family N-acetyltransferase [Flavobacterium lutivivi]|nr:GNAT family N-acetyltransferase [Flavobacterium lutivivi]
MRLVPIQMDEDKSKSVFLTKDCQDLLEAYENYYPIIGYNLPWVGYFIYKDEKIVGSCGFTGKPTNGEVEIAYWTFKEFENRGIASFACQELIKIAKKEDKTIKIIAKTAPEHNASTKILENNNFIYSDMVNDEEIGDAWLWKLNS